ncbi:MAG: ABC transporter ATP-binding protein [Candidatus Saccharibacteria bacterium]|nr:ABC transporter ATP-binding protein [Candidatus Saccharibacteria bacterium]
MPGHIKGATQKPKNMKKTMRQFLGALKKWRVALIVVCVVSIISTALTTVGPMILGQMTTSATTSLANGEGVKWDELGTLAVILIILYIVSGVIGYLASVILVRITAKFSKEMREQIMAKISRLPVSYFDKVQIGDVMSRMTNDVETVAGQFGNTVTTIIISVTTLVGMLAMMLYISVSLSIIAIVVVPLGLIVVGKITRKAQKYFRAQRTLLGTLNSTIEEDYTGQSIIRANSHEAKSISAFKQTNSQLYNASWKSQFYGSLAFPVTHVFTNIGYIAICVLGGHFALIGAITIGNLQAFIQYVNRFNRPITEVAQMAATIQQIMAAAERIFEFLNEEEEPVEKNVRNIDIEAVKGEVEFHDMAFSYDKKKPVISNFSCKITPGMNVAIVGPTGAGKTTVVNLLMRFYDPDSGYITIDGVPTSELARKDVRRMFGMVLQDTWLFSGTVYDNLKYGAEDATEADVKRAVKAVGIEHFIESLPKGYKTEISEDSDNISAGEKQLLTIARAMVADQPMMILDEATSNVDTRTEQLIQNAFDKLTEGRTSFVIAHRLSTIRNSDLILVMKDGNIIEQGKHEDLLALNGFYAELYNSQFAQ